MAHPTLRQPQRAPAHLLHAGSLKCTKMEAYPVTTAVPVMGGCLQPQRALCSRDSMQ